MLGKKLYVGNLSYSATVEQITALFEDFGEIKQANVIDGKGFGFVEFAEDEQAAKAKDELDGILFDGRNIKVDVANPSGKKGESGSKLYVGNINYNVTVEQLTKLFEQFGEVTHVNLLEGRGYGFIEFTTQDNAQKAKEELDGKDFEGRNIKIDFAGKKKDNQRPNRGNERYNSRY